MRRFPPREPPPERRPDRPTAGRLRRDLPRPEGPFDRLLRRRPERDPAPIIIGGTVGFLALVIVTVLLFSQVLGGGGSSNSAVKSDATIDIAPGIKGRRAQLPALPPGLAALSDFIEFDAKEDVPVSIGLPITEAIDNSAGLGFYTFFDDRWQRLAEVDVKEIEGKTLGEADFTSVPKNLAILRVLAQTYQVAGSLPPGGSLHPDAKVNFLNPRDYTPAADGSVQGKATQVSAPGALLMPTIVGSSQESASVVNDILADESLRAEHIKSITTLVNDANLDGIDLEYSSVDVNLASQFTDFTKSLADSLHQSHKRLSLTLPPPTSQRQAYEWKDLGKSADFIKILPIADPVAYWETMPGALGQLVKDVERGKLMLVVSPFSVEGTGDVTRPLGYLQAMLLAGEAVVREPNPADITPGTTVKVVAKNLDEGEGASPLRWSNEAAAVSFALGGTERKRIFIENSFSVAFKLELVQAYGLGGIAVADASSQSDVADVWPAVNQLVQSATLSLARPNDATLLPVWQAEGGDLGAGAGTTATWIAPDAGTYNIVLVVSDGERRFGRKLPVEVKKGNQPSPTPLITFAPETPTPTPTAVPTATVSPTPTPAASLLVKVGMRADGDDPDSEFTNNEITSPGSTVRYLVLIDNNSNVPVTITSLKDNVYGSITCDGGDVVGKTLAADDGDAGGAFDGGPDQLQCIFTETAPDSSGKTVHNTITVVVKDAEGNSAFDQDDATITTS